MFDINEWLRETRKVHTLRDGSVIEDNRPRLICEDGYSVSVQASRFHYCSPRIDGADNYESVELGYPNQEDSLINDYAEDDTYTDTVYGCVPVKVVNKLIEKHGGITNMEIYDNKVTKILKSWEDM